jgi:hypothetical protein
MFLNIKGVIVTAMADFSFLKGRKNMNTPKWIVSISLVLALAMSATPVSAQSPSTSVTLSPPTPNPGIVGGDISFTLVVNVANIVPGVAGIDFFMSFDPLFVTPSPFGVVESLPDFFGPSNVISSEILPAGPPCPPGGFPCIHLVAAGPAQVTRSGAVARFHFVGAFPTVPATPTCFGAFTAISMVNADGFPVVAPPAPVPQCVPIVPSSVTGTVLRQGIPIPPASLPPGTLGCSEVRLISGGVVIFGPAFTAFPPPTSNNFAIPLIGVLPSGVLTVRAEYPGYLASQKTITIGAGGGLFDVGTTTLRGGDINGDNRINILDVGMLIVNFGAPFQPMRSDLAAGCTDADEPADINDDGIINISDIAIIAGANFGLVGPTPWQ